MPIRPELRPFYPAHWRELSRRVRARCQRCHMPHDRPHHLAQRWITYNRRYALGALFSGRYENAMPGTA